MPPQVAKAKEPPRAKLTIRDILNELVERTNSNMRRLRVLEEKADTMVLRMDTIEQAVREQRDALKKTATDLEKRMIEDSERVIRIEAGLKDMASKFKKVVTTTKIRELEELVDIYNPLKSNFVTKEEVQAMLAGRKK
jgi:hypothetical protein